MKPEFRKHHSPAESLENALVWTMACVAVSLGTAALGAAIYESFSASAKMIERPPADSARK